MQRPSAVAARPAQTELSGIGCSFDSTDVGAAGGSTEVGCSGLVQPAASAGASFQLFGVKGEFHGVMIATTPVGS